MHFGCVELVGSTPLTRRAWLARHVERVESWRDDPSGIWAILRRCQGRTGPPGCLALARWPVGPPARWAATSKCWRTEGTVR